MDDNAVHPRMKHDAPTVGINAEHLSPEMDKQRRRESVQLDEDGEEFKEIQQLREERWKLQDMRDGVDHEEEAPEDPTKELGDLDGVWFDGALPDMSGLSRLETDPAAAITSPPQT